MIINLGITKEQKKALLNRYPSVKSFLQRTLSETADRLIADYEINNYTKELDEFHARQALNEGVEWVKGTPFWKDRHHTQATKDKISKTLKEKYRGTEFHLLPETRQRISESNKGRVPWIKGKHHSQKTKDLIGKAHKGMVYKKRIKVSEEKVECIA